MSEQLPDSYEVVTADFFMHYIEPDAIHKGAKFVEIPTTPYRSMWEHTSQFPDVITIQLWSIDQPEGVTVCLDKDKTLEALYGEFPDSYDEYSGVSISRYNANSHHPQGLLVIGLPQEDEQGLLKAPLNHVKEFVDRMLLSEVDSCVAQIFETEDLR